MTDFLLELRSEEIPARMQAGARAELEKLFRREMEAAGVSLGELTVWSTPRRLALIARDLPQATEAVSEEAKGPPEGAPDPAVEGFCRKNGVTRDQLEVRDVKGRPTYFAVIEKPGRAVRDVLAETIPAIIRDFAWPKSMRWGAASISTESLRWVRPLSGIVALLGDEVVECEVHLGGSPEKVGTGFSPGDPTTKRLTSGSVTLGHRFHHTGDVTIGNADDYAVKLRAAHVIVDHEERAALVREVASKVASDAGLRLVEDEGLVIENAGLTEWPVPLLGRFDEAFLDVPPEVIQLTARVNQKYFVCEDKDGKLANAFVCTANIAAEDGGAAIVDGNRKVLAARLSDARFFWELDQKTPLAEQAKKLERITFHEKLGTVADKVERVAKLARWLVEEGIVTDNPLPPAGGERDFASGSEPSRSGVGSGEPMPTPNPSRRREGELADLAEQAARLCKADLVTEMVGEFPELQGLMGGYYARAEGLPDAVADAIRDHYKPVGQGDEVPTAPVTVAVSLADKLDTIFQFFSIGEKPSGSKDPFALRRQAIAANRLTLSNALDFSIFDALIASGASILGPNILKDSDQYSRVRKTAEKVAAELGENLAEKHVLIAALRMLGSQVLAFFGIRMQQQLKSEGKRSDYIEAALSGRVDKILVLNRASNALQSFMATEDGINLLAGYKRAANILKKEDWHGAEGEIARTGEEDPLAMVDDPDMKAVVDAKMAERHASELSYPPEPAEQALMDALADAEPRATAAIEAEDFSAAMAALASLRAPIDRFFDEVTVNAEEENKRAHRLDLLAQFRAAVHKVADFSRIEG